MSKELLVIDTGFQARNSDLQARKTNWTSLFRIVPASDLNGTIELTNTWKLNAQRTNDTFLMEHFLNLKTFTPKELKILNACRMYYQVTRVSDISTPDGSRLVAKISNGTLSREKLNLVYQSQLEWPAQDKPNKASWKLWQKALRLTICNVSGRLYKPLGSWNKELDPNWKYYLSTTDNFLYNFEGKTWYRYTPIRLGLTQTYNKVGQISQPPNLPYPATPHLGHHYYTCHHSCSRRTMHTKARKTTYSTLEEYITQNGKPWEKHLLSDIEEQYDAGITLLEALSLGLDIWFGTDGGDTDGNGYFGWVIATDTHILFAGKGLSPGTLGKKAHELF
jgi:hypothetical protein